jgi:hypothetical protein
MPKKEMQAWLKGRASWNHQEWLALLADLSAKGFGYWTESAEGRTALGEYLEANRGK